MNVQETSRLLYIILSALTDLLALLTLTSGYTSVTFFFIDISFLSFVFALS